MPSVRVIIALSILALVFSNMAWSMDVCVPHAGQPAQYSESASGALPDDGSATGCCDGLCHCCMQLFCIVSPDSPGNAGNGHSSVTFSLSLYHSLLRKPPTEPPRV